MTHQAVSAVMKMTPSDYSTSQGPNSMLQNTLNKIHSTSLQLIFSQEMFQPWKPPHWFISIEDPEYLGQQSKLTLLFLWIVLHFHCSRRCQNGQTNGKEERPRYGSLLDAAWPFLL